MLEILLLIHLSKKIAAKAREKGRSGGWFVLLLLFLWFGGEIAGAIAAAVALEVAGEDNFFIVYLAALAGAVCGGVFAFLIVGALTPVRSEDDYDYADDNDHDDADRDHSRGGGRRDGDRDDERDFDRDRY